ncbi:DUF4232 domain-containing protein [Saccharopolyspora phatthalungensis]|uniref:DUF4232 domain-containing protein n=1 Tax=Saccharopolyspora phatthalungensis TaxID=664693 RepID=A0A840Q776_9PSEU|nr:DUF4232 domain-containing protein [Saccharopolyspora phatthalungensis]MBB5154558.1 hypothetical protein [Saccharopolyspora phatthalungensis]
MPNRTRMLGAIAGLFTGALLLAGCGQPVSDSAVSPSEVGWSSRTPSGVATSASLVDSNNSAQPTGAKCSAADFAVDLNVQPGRPGILLMAVTNRSTWVCSLNGWADVVPQDMAGTSRPDVPSEQVEVPGAPTEISLASGETAFAGVRLELGDKADDHTVVTTGFRAHLPGAEGTVNADIIGTGGSAYGAGYPEFPIKSMQVGSLQPSAQGVTAF